MSVVLTFPAVPERVATGSGVSDVYLRCLGPVRVFGLPLEAALRLMSETFPASVAVWGLVGAIPGNFFAIVFVGVVWPTPCSVPGKSLRRREPILRIHSARGAAREPGRTWREPRRC